MQVGRGAAAAILGAGALGAAVGAFALGQTRPQDVTPLVAEAQAGIEAASAASLRELEAEVTAAASLSQLHAALGNRVDAVTMEDLFQTERWWAPYRDHAVALIGPHGPVMARNAPAGGLGGERLAAKAAPGHAASEVARLGERPFLEAAAGIDVPDVGRVVLVLGRPLDQAILGAWSKRAHAELVVTDGRQVLLSEGAAPTLPLVGHEGGAPIVDDAGGFAAASVALSPGLWAWGVRRFPADAGSGKTRAAALWVLAGVLGVAAVGLAISRRRRAGVPEAAPPEMLPPAGTVSAAPVLTPSSFPVAAMPRHSSAAMPTVIASGEAQTFGRYTIIDRLGEGGMCELFIAGLAGPEGFQRRVVLKRLKPEIARNRAAVDQFIDEAKLGSTLVHSNIVSVLDFGIAGDRYFLAQEYVVGRNIGEIILRHHERLRQPLDVRTVFYIAHEALQALAYAHDKASDDGAPMNLVHRDVSPGNILVSERGEVKLIDFGIAKAEGRVSHTDIGNIKGNAAFMAPEQARGLALDRRADLFSLGLVMYNALIGEPLYQGGTSAEVFYNAASGPSPERLERLASLPPVVAQVLGKALAADPADRYATADEFAADLGDHLVTGARTGLATLLTSLFGHELRPLQGGGGGGPGPGTSSVRRRV